MSQRASPAMVGGFVLGAAALAILGVVVFGRGLLVGDGDRYTIHFDESLKGLRIGDPVTFRGVEVGEVRDIRAIIEPGSGAVQVPVTVEIRPGSLDVAGDGETQAGSVIPKLVADGLRARLDVQSIVTGQLLVSLDFYPQLGASAGAAPPGEIPSIPSTLAGLQQSVDQAIMNLPEMAATLGDLTRALRDLLAGETGAKLRAGVAALSDIASQLGDPNSQVGQVLAEMPALLHDLGASAQKLPPLLDKLDGLAAAGGQALGDGQPMRTLIADAGRLSASASRVADQASRMLVENREGVREFTESGLPQIMGLVDDATRLVNELSAVVRDIRQDPARFFLGDRANQGVRLQ